MTNYVTMAADDLRHQETPSAGQQIWKYWYGPALMVRDEEAAGSNPATPTRKHQLSDSYGPDELSAARFPPQVTAQEVSAGQPARGKRMSACDW